MSNAPADFAIFGSTPLARLVAGLLAGVHGRRVVWVGDSHAAFRLPRGIDLSAGPLTRPESWALLAQTVPETLKILTRAGGKASVLRLDPILFAETPLAEQALGFIASSAAGFGHAVERMPAGQRGAKRGGIVLRDAAYLQRDRLEPVLDQWLEAMQVTRIALAEAQAEIFAGGSARIEWRGKGIWAARAILADDGAMLRLLPEDVVSGVLQPQAMSTILTEPTLPMAAPVMLQIDADLSFVQGGHRGVTAIGAGDSDGCAARVGALLGPNRQLRQAGSAQHHGLRSLDGGAIIGPLPGDGPTILGGLGATGAFLAPALARWLVGAAQPDEATYFAARAPGRAMDHSTVAEYRPPDPALAAA